MTTPITALIDYEDAYCRPKIVNALHKLLPDIQILDSAPLKGSEPTRYLQWSDYEKIDWDGLLKNKDWLACAYIIRFALIPSLCCFLLLPFSLPLDHETSQLTPPAKP